MNTAETVIIKPVWILRDIPVQNFPVSTVTSLRLVFWRLDCPLAEPYTDGRKCFTVPTGWGCSWGSRPISCLWHWPPQLLCGETHQCCPCIVLQILSLTGKKSNKHTFPLTCRSFGAVAGLTALLLLMSRLHVLVLSLKLHYSSMTVCFYLQKMLEKLRAKKAGKAPWLAEHFTQLSWYSLGTNKVLHLH